MDTRRPAAYGQCPYRNNRPAQPNQMMRAPAQAPPASRASAASLARPNPAAKPTLIPAAEPKPEPAPPKLQPTQAKPLPSPPPAQPARAWLSAYAKDFTVAAESGGKEPLPLEPQRSDGGLALGPGGVTVPADGYYMLLWELGVAGASGGATLQLGINDAASQLTYALQPGYDSGQQVTWLSKGDKLALYAQADSEKAEINCSSAQFTVIRLG